MRYDSFFNNALVDFYRSIIAVSAIVFSTASFAVAPPVHDIWSKPTGSTGANIGAGYTIHRNGVMTSSNPVKLPDGKIVSFADGKVTIKDASVSSKINASVRAGAGAMKRGAVRCFSSLRCNVATIVVGSGIEQLFDGLDWVMGEGGKIQKRNNLDPDFLPPDGSVAGTTVSSSYNASALSLEQAIASFKSNSCTGDCFFVRAVFVSNINNHRVYGCNPNFMHQGSLLNYAGFNGTSCYYKADFQPEESFSDVPDSEVSTKINDFYDPNEKDWGVVGPWIPVADPDLELEITNLPRLTLPTRTRTIYDADGQAVEVEETNIWHDFDISANPSKNPQIEGKKTEEKKTFKDGVLTSTSTTTSSSSPDTNTPSTPEAEQLTDCLFFPTLCEWLDWTREEPVEPTDDLSSLLKEVSVSNKSYTITGGAAACPAPLSLNLAQFGNREVSYQPLCDLATTMRPLYLALMAFLSAMLIHRSINRV